MNRLTTHACAVAALAAAGLAVQCSKAELSEEGGGGGSNPETVTLTIRNSESTKTSIDGQTGKVYWSQDDYIMINGSTYPVIPDENDPTVATVQDVWKSESYFAVYSDSWSYEQYTEDGNLAGYDVYFPGYQQYADGSFGNFANLMVGYSTSEDISFRNIGGIVRFGVTGTGTLRSLAFSTIDGSPVAGYVSIPAEKLYSGNLDGCSDFNPEYGSVSAIGINFWQGYPVLDESEPTDFYIVVPAKEYAEGFYITMEDTDGNVAVQSTTGAKTVVRSEILSLPDFRFTPLSAPEIEAVEATPTSVSYTVRTVPGAPLRSVLMSKDAWETYLTEYNGAEDTLAMDVASLAAETFLADASGISGRTETTAYNIQGEVSLSAGTEYKLVVSFANNSYSVGIPAVFDVATGAPEGTAPEVTVSFADSEYPYKELTPVINTVGAAGIKVALYESGTHTGATPEEIIADYGTELPQEYVDLANSPEGVEVTYTRLEENTSYTLIVSATGEGGMAKVISDEKTTGYYISPDAQWKTVSTRAALECGIFERFGIHKRIEGLTVEKMEGKDIFRIVNPFTPETFPEAGEYGLTLLDKTSYITIDVTDPEAVKLEQCANYLGVCISEGQEIYLVSRGFIQDGASFGWYDEQSGTIEFGEVIAGWGSSSYFWSGWNMLELHISHSAGTEDFVIGDETEW